MEEIIDGFRKLYNGDKGTKRGNIPFITLVFDVIIFGILGIVLALIIDQLIPRPTLNESLAKSILWLFVQLVIAAIVITSVVKFTPLILPREADEFGGLSIFVLLFFAAQAQFRFRLAKITYQILGIDITLENGRSKDTSFASKVNRIE